MTVRTFAVTAALFGAVFLCPASAHGPAHWIEEKKLVDPVTNQWCCNLNDCREEPDNVEPVSGGYLVKSTGEVIPTERVIWRSPGGWWRCRNLNDNSTRCLIGAPPGS